MGRMLIGFLFIFIAIVKTAMAAVAPIKTIRSCGVKSPGTCPG